MANVLTRIKSALLPTASGGITDASNAAVLNTRQAVKNLSRIITPVQLQRLKEDVQTWREGVLEMENSWYPHRVKVQRTFMDTILNGHVFACKERRENLTILKKYRMVNKTSRVVNPKTTEIFQTKWFRQYMKFQIEAKAFGYSLIYLDDLINGGFPKISIIRRFNISPDRLNVTRFVYSISGVPFLEEPQAQWHIWVDTPTDVGVSTCGYGYLYKVALYEIFARNLLTQNADATERFGMPILKGRTNKLAESEERAIFEQALAEMGSAGYMLLDTVGDDIEMLESKSLGLGYKIYESLEKRIEQKMSKIILGHADAMDSTPGKLGAGQGDDNPVSEALSAIATVDMNDLADCTNNQLIPKLRTLGFLIPEEEVFEFENNEEIQEIREREDESNLNTATVFKTIKDAGGEPDWEYFSKRTGIMVKKAEPLPVPGAMGGDEPPPGEKDPKKKGKDIKGKLKRLYEHNHV